MKPAEFRAVFLSGDVVYVRAYVDQDKEVTAAWAGTPFPVGSPRGEKLLKEWHTEWWPRTRHYALCHASTDEVVGGVIVGIRHLVAEFIVTVAPWRDDADELRAEAIKLIVPWLSDEWSMVSVQAHMAADEPACIAPLRSLGCRIR